MLMVQIMSNRMVVPHRFSLHKISLWQKFGHPCYSLLDEFQSQMRGSCQALVCSVMICIQDSLYSITEYYQCYHSGACHLEDTTWQVKEKKDRFLARMICSQSDSFIVISSFANETIINKIRPMVSTLNFICQYLFYSGLINTWNEERNDLLGLFCLTVLCELTSLFPLLLPQAKVICK